MQLRIVLALLALRLSLSSTLPAQPGPPILGDAPPAPTPETIERLRREQGPTVLGPSGPFIVDTTRREDVRNFFNAVYSASSSFDEGWTGNLATCDPGGTDAAFQDQVLLRINFFRAMAGIPAEITFNSTYSHKDQQAALMMSANSTLSHTPPSSWTCWTGEGAEAAGNSNLALGNSGPDAIDAYIHDFGDNNRPVGHRRWLLYPQTRTMGTGDLPAPDDQHYSANAVWVFDGNYSNPRPTTRDGFVAWPPPGYVPAPILYPRWSFSLPNASFSGATVTLSSNGVPVPVSLEPLTANIGEPTLVWYPSALDPTRPYTWPTPARDDVYTVHIEGARIGNVASNFTYSVVVFDPATPGPDTVLPVISGTDTPFVNQTNLYTCSAVSGATGYQWRLSRITPFTATEGAENGLTNFDAAVSPGYNVIVPNPRHSGTRAFHLAHPNPPTSQTLTYAPVLLPDSNAQLRFWSRLGWATADQHAQVEVSADDGNSWETVFDQPGTGDAGETSFNQRTVSLDAYSGRAIRVRFRYSFASGSFFNQTDTDVGWLFDDIAFTSTSELTSPTREDTPGASYGFNPAAPGAYALDARAQLYDDYYAEWGPAKHLLATNAPSLATLQFSSTPAITNGEVHLVFDVTDYQPNLLFQLHHTPAISPTTWTVETRAVFEPVIPASRFRVRAPADAAAKFYRVSAQ